MEGTSITPRPVDIFEHVYRALKYGYMQYVIYQPLDIF